ncbi:MAG: PQQ-binding-like beta-propeller repeat protein [Planctomycetota bacterium]
MVPLLEMTMLNAKKLLSVCFVVSVLVLAGPATAADWPMWRYGPNRGAASPHRLPAELHLQWVRDYPTLETAWPDQPRLRFDKTYHPVVMGRLMFLGSHHDDSVRALDIETGAEKWVFHPGGPVRFAPVAWRGRLYVGCEDGCLYCLDAGSGRLRWKFRAAPAGRYLLGNRRVISAWPVRGAPVVADGNVYVAAGIWPFMGVFLYCLDAETGEVVWHNDRCGFLYTLRPHYSRAFSGLAPQGYLAVEGDDLLVPNGRTRVARLDRETGRLIYHEAPRGGTYHLAATQDFFFNAGCLFYTRNGRMLSLQSSQALVLEGQAAYTTLMHQVRAHDLSYYRAKARNRLATGPYAKTEGLMWRVPVRHTITALIKAGPRLYAGGKGGIDVIHVPGNGGSPKVSWTADLDGTPIDLLAAGRKLFAVTLAGRIYCFGAKKTRPRRYELEEPPPPDRDTRMAATVKTILDKTGAREGYCVVLGVEDGELLEQLAHQSDLHIVAVEDDAAKVAELRRSLDQAGLYGHRVAVHHADPAAHRLPPYLANLVLSADLDRGNLVNQDALIKQAYRVLRPYGGTLCLREGERTLARVVAACDRLDLEKAQPKVASDIVLLVREGRLPGSADWTHQYADIANTVMSKDERVKAPLGLLWFGGPSNRKILPRHGHGPIPQVVGGRLFIEGPDVLRALDVYTGRELWEKRLPGVGAAYDNTSHQPGANAMGSNYCATEDAVYVAYGRKALRLDPATGRTVAEFTLPRSKGADTDPRWGFIGVYKDLLIAGADPISFSNLFDEESVGRRPIGWLADGSSSERLVVLDRHSGRVLWDHKATHGLIHNSICAGGGMVFCIDRPRMPRGVMSREQWRAHRSPPGSAVLAFHAETGKRAWRDRKRVFGTWLGHSADHDALLQAGRPSRDMTWDEPDSRMILYRASTGKRLWDRPNEFRGLCILHGRRVITGQQAFELATGEPVMTTHPITGQRMPWTYSRNYGCGTVVGSKHLLTFRSAAAGYLDLTTDAGTGNFGGFKSGCTNNLIAADGVLNASDYTRTCICGYPNQSSLAMVHMPEVETWTFTESVDWHVARVRRLGVNLGARRSPGAPNGTMWYEYPLVGGPSPALKIKTADLATWYHKPNPGLTATVKKEPRWYYHHSSRLSGDGLKWVAASGCENLTRLTVGLSRVAARKRPYTVRLTFAEPSAGVEPGDRVFDVALQDERVLKGFDVCQAAGGPRRGIVREFKGVQVLDDLVISLAPRAGGDRALGPVLSGVEVVAEGR